MRDKKTGETFEIETDDNGEYQCEKSLKHCMTGFDIEFPNTFTYPGGIACCQYDAEHDSTYETEPQKLVDSDRFSATGEMESFTVRVERPDGYDVGDASGIEVCITRYVKEYRTSDGAYHIEEQPSEKSKESWAFGSSYTYPVNELDCVASDCYASWPAWCLSGRVTNYSFRVLRYIYDSES